MEFARTSRQTSVVVINLCVAGGAAAWCLYDAWIEGAALNWVLGLVLVAWTAFVAQNLIRYPVFMRVNVDSLTINTTLGPVSFAFADIEWANLEPGARLYFFAYRKAGRAKTKYTGIKPRDVSPDAIQYLRAALQNARPDLPDRDPSAASEQTSGA